MAFKIPIRIRGEKSNRGLEAERVFSADDWFITQTRLERSLRIVIARGLENFDISVQEWLLIERVINKTEEDYSIGAVSEDFDIPLPKATALVAAVAKKGYVSTKPSTKDRRVKLLYITRKGRKIAFESGQTVQHAFRYWLFDLSDREIIEFSELSNKITSFEIPPSP